MEGKDMYENYIIFVRGEARTNPKKTCPKKFRACLVNPLPRSIGVY
jgi:hypothetical protein